MTDRVAPAPLPGAGAAEALARDWVTVWQSELAATAVDREAQEHWQALLALWAEAAAGLFAWGADERHGSRPAASPRPPASDAAPDARDAEIERLARRVAELERRIDGFG